MFSGYSLYAVCNQVSWFYTLCMQVAWKYFYSTGSAGEHGTMYQLRNLIGRSNVTANPVHRFNECDDFFKLLVTCHILVAAMQLLQMKSLEDTPCLSTVTEPAVFWMEDAVKRKSVLQSISEDIVEKFVSFDFNKPPALSKDMVSVVVKKLY